MDAASAAQRRMVRSTQCAVREQVLAEWAQVQAQHSTLDMQCAVAAHAAVIASESARVTPS